MEYRTLNRFIAIGVFAVALLIYVLCLPPTVVFWDVGEFIAAAYLLQVPHPPGAPFFLLIGRILGMIPFAADIAVRMHFLSALSSALTVMFLYLVTVRFIVIWRGRPETAVDRLAVYGSGVIAALSLAFSSTFWFNAEEAEVYGLSMLFVSAILWLGLRWYERADWKRSDLYLLLISYLVGLSVGVHLLAVLTLFSVMLLVYFRHYEVTMASLVRFGLVALGIFFLVYPGIVKEFPSMLDGEIRGSRNELITYVPIAAILGALYGVYYSYRNKKHILHVGLLCFLLIVLGYSTYALVYIRANANPPMNENDPSTLTKLVSYLNREQYGQAPVLERRYGADPEQRAAHQKYSSDLDFLWRYQVNHMYIRYFLWNYVGREGDYKDAGWDFKEFYALPLLLGLFGAYYQWRRTPKMFVVAAVSFIVMGVLLALYQNQQEPQPRERDYFYVGSFFIFSMWIGMGALGLIDLLRERLTRRPQAVTLGVLGLVFIAIPANMVRVNWHEADRSGQYVAWDYSYNLLQSCERDAILFTNGDNDTFPLWYLQDVEGVRRDIRVVNLSLLNTPWYIHQLKNLEPHGARKVPIGRPDAQIRNIQPVQYETQTFELPVPKELIQKYNEVLKDRGGLQDTALLNRQRLSFVMPHTIEFGNIKALRVQDLMVLDIVFTNAWERPIYFAMTVADDGKIGLRDYLRMEGLAFRLAPVRGQVYWNNLDEEKMRAHLFTDVVDPSREPQLGYRWRGLTDSTQYHDEDVRRLMLNYRQAFFSLGYYYTEVREQPERFAEVLDRMERVIPRSVMEMPTAMKFDVGMFYNRAGRTETMKEYMHEIVEELKPVVEARTAQRLAQDNPYLVLLSAYQLLQRYSEADQLLDVIQAVYRNEPGVNEYVGQERGRIRMQMTLDSLAAAEGKAPPVP